ncbi:MAG: hypothetical protein JWQ96_1580 [Segetibacter sp.]|nr:hypothetical protein [Segetibacter sp.]
MAKSTGKKAAAKKGAAKKVATKAAAPKKGAAKKAAAKSAAPKKGAAKKVATKAVAPKKGAAKKVATKAAAPKKAAAKKVAAKKAAFKSAAPKKLAVRSKPTVINDEALLQELFLDHLKDIYWAEKSLTKALPKMRKAATSPELQQIFEQHLTVTEGQIGRLEQVFELLGKKAQGKKCDAMEGLSKETESVISDTPKGSKTRDVGLIIAAQKVEHYEIASYGGLATLAAVMGMSEAKELLGQTLAEEKEADQLLTQLAESNINQEAAEEGEEGGSGESESEDDKSMDADEVGEGEETSKA